MTNSGFSRLLDLHEREDYNTALSEEAVRHMIAEEFEEADKIISVGFDEATFETLGADGQMFIPTRKSEKFHMRKHTACQRPYYHGAFVLRVHIYSVGRVRSAFQKPRAKLDAQKRSGVPLSARHGTFARKEPQGG